MYRNPVETFLGRDELYATKENDSWEGRPEFELFNKKNYTVNEGEKAPEITFMSAQGPNELPPL